MSYPGLSFRPPGFNPYRGREERRVQGLDYLLSDLQQSQINRLQHVQTSAARLLTATSRYEHVTPVLRSSHWLPVSVRFDFKILLLVFKVLNGLGSLYLNELLRPYIPYRNLRSSKKKHMDIERSS